MSTDLYAQSQSVKKTIFFWWLLSRVLARKRKESQFSNAQFNLEKCATAKTGHLHEEEAKEEKKFQLFPLAKEGKGELNSLLSHKRLFNRSIKTEKMHKIFLHFGK